MNNREDYLDSLLKAVIDPKEEVKSVAKKPVIVSKEDDFLMKYDQELLDLDEDSFLQQFEMDLIEEDNIETISKVQEKLGELEEFDDLMVDNIEQDDLPDVEYDIDLANQLFQDNNVLDDISDEEIAVALQQNMENAAEAMANTEQEMIEDPQRISEESELLDILSGMAGDDDLAEIGNMLKAHDENEIIESGEESELPPDLAQLFGTSGTETEADASVDSVDAMLANAKKIGKDSKKEKTTSRDTAKKSTGFLQKLAKIFFGEDDVEIPEADEIDNISDENMEILRDLEKADQKKKKKEKKAKKDKTPKKQKVKKPPKPKKPSKPKAPVEKTKPLPKAPVVLIFIMCASMVVLVYLGTNLIGYSSAISQAKSMFDQGNYVEAYQVLQGMDLKKADQKFFERTRLTAYLQNDMNSYRAYIMQGMYPEALDSLIFVVGRYDKYIAEAVEYGADGEYEGIVAIAEEELSQTFGMTIDEARQVYNLTEREVYTKRVYEILERVGLAE